MTSADTNLQHEPVWFFCVELSMRDQPQELKLIQSSAVSLVLCVISLQQQASYSFSSSVLGIKAVASPSENINHNNRYYKHQLSYLG